ncbi:hypothetical protein V6N13_050729 [Hibiscus sabdariffa]|uniref:MORF/ORRM1/DAG-like MORF domain-containing protein n=1 Tax=Hibiscus sabdariffa TaxID=183260 RepID=A0ABR2PIJ6_9ROSI
MIDCYIKTLAKVVGSEEEAKKKIYNVSCERYFGFGCEIDEETSNKLEGLPGVLFVLPDSYVDPENKDYGAELFVNGEIVQRSPERQRRVEPQPQRAQDRPRYNDRTRYVRRRENMRFARHTISGDSVICINYQSFTGRLCPFTGNLSTTVSKTVEKNGLDAVAKKAGIDLCRE